MVHFNDSDSVVFTGYYSYSLLQACSHNINFLAEIVFFATEVRSSDGILKLGKTHFSLERLCIY